MMRHKKRAFLAISLALALAILVAGVAVAQAPPPASPAIYSGSVTTVAGDPAPDGALVIAEVEGLKEAWPDWPVFSDTVEAGNYDWLKVFSPVGAEWVGTEVAFYIDVDGLDNGLERVPATPAVSVTFVAGDRLTVNLTYTPPVVLESIAVAPATASIEEGATQQYTATAIFSDESEVDVTAVVTWASSDEAVATISEAGLATAIAAGSTTLTATCPVTGLSGDATLTVTAPPPPTGISPLWYVVGAAVVIVAVVVIIWLVRR